MKKAQLLDEKLGKKKEITPKTLTENPKATQKTSGESKTCSASHCENKGLPGHSSISQISQKSVACLAFTLGAREG